MHFQDARTYALSLPEATEAPHFDYTSFRVGGKIFVTAPPGEEFLHIFVDEDARAPLIQTFPEAFAPLPWGKKIVGVRVTVAKAERDAVCALIFQAWMKRAPKRLVVARELGQ